ncbi:ABC transporter ATP-binding protein [Cumulibacter soli]|uniref:ABC transporter ATP-binding protein n=1 Tax=Cumulibacter soli TaxID=2546344 RepID=UPI001ABBB261|nr:ATP-binding cassette domain-containing protein [Cumulibacter soli]
MLRLTDLSVTYPGASSPVFCGLNLDVPAGTTYGVHAPSGSGKTTLLKAAALLLPLTSGAVAVDGTTVDGKRFAVPQDVRRRIGVVFQSPRASTDTRLSLRDIIAAPLSHDRGFSRPRAARFTDQIAELAERVQLSDDLLDRLPHQVSDGQLQRACLARALALNPRVLICDEPTAMLDAPTTAIIMRLLTEQASSGSAVLLASHDLALLDATCSVVSDKKSLIW